MPSQNIGEDSATPNQGRIVAADIRDAQSVVVGEGAGRPLWQRRPTFAAALAPRQPPAQECDLARSRHLLPLAHNSGARAFPDLLPEPARALLAAGGEIRLPTEQEWVKAARGWYGRKYSWSGKNYQVGFANVEETRESFGPNGLKHTSAVGM